MKAADLSDQAVLDAVDAGSKRLDGYATLMDLAPFFPGVPEKVLLTKLRRLINRKLLRGCTCGCRGDFSIAYEGGST